MDFSFSEEQQAVAELAAQIFGDHAERVREVERSVDRVDRRLWSALAAANLLGIALPEEHGGSGLGMVELCLELEAQGRSVAPVPLLWTVVAAMCIAEFGDAGTLNAVVGGETMLTVALSEGGAGDPASPAVAASSSGGTWVVDGTKTAVPYAHVAAGVLVPARSPAGPVVVLVDPRSPGVEVELAEATDRQLLSHLTFRTAPAALIAGADDGARAVRFLVERTMTGIAALQVGVAEEALARAASYTSTRHQFGKPLSTFQSTSARAADAYIDIEAMRATLWEAAWRLDQGLDASVAVEVAKWWAAEAGERVVHATQHLHGGVGADVDYPIHRFFLWGKQLADTLGGASAHLARLGRLLATGVQETV